MSDSYETMNWILLGVGGVLGLAMGFNHLLLLLARRQKREAEKGAEAVVAEPTGAASFSGGRLIYTSSNAAPGKGQVLSRTVARAGKRRMKAQERQAGA